MHNSVLNLQDFAKNLAQVVEEVSRLEAVNEEFYQKIQLLVHEKNNLNQIIEGHKFTASTMESLITKLSKTVREIVEEVMTSENLITLKVDMDLRRDNLKEVFS